MRRGRFEFGIWSSESCGSPSQSRRQADVTAPPPRGEPGETASAAKVASAYPPPQCAAEQCSALRDPPLGKGAWEGHRNEKQPLRLLSRVRSTADTSPCTGELARAADSRLYGLSSLRLGTSSGRKRSPCPPCGARKSRRACAESTLQQCHSRACFATARQWRGCGNCWLPSSATGSGSQQFLGIFDRCGNSGFASERLAVPEKPFGLTLILRFFDRCGDCGSPFSATGSGDPQSCHRQRKAGIPRARGRLAGKKSSALTKEAEGWYYFFAPPPGGAHVGLLSSGTAGKE